MPSEEEIKENVWNLHPLKSPGPDGFQGIFYRKYWNIIKDNLCNFVWECFRCGRILERSNRTFIALIPKIDIACNFNQF